MKQTSPTFFSQETNPCSFCTHGVATGNEIRDHRNNLIGHICDRCHPGVTIHQFTHYLRKFSVPTFSMQKVMARNVRAIWSQKIMNKI